MDCNWKLDGRPMDPLKANDSKIVSVSPGEHRIQAATTDGVATIRTKVVTDQDQKIVEIQLKSQHDRQLKMQQAETARKQAEAEAEAALHPTWTDPETGLMWAKKDNGSDVNWNQASSYCSNLQLAGYKDWRLPSIQELEGIYDPSIRVQAVFDEGWILSAGVKRNLKLTGWDWSSSQGPVPGSPQPVARVFNFAKTEEKESASFPLGFNYSSRALSVRRSAE
jgi:hypothetical protein